MKVNYLSVGRIRNMQQPMKVIYLSIGRILDDESLMWYAEGISSDDFQDSSFQPIFTPSFTTQEEAHVQQLCGDDSSCRLDYAATRNTDVATASASFNKLNTENRLFLGKYDCYSNLIEYI